MDLFDETTPEGRAFAEQSAEVVRLREKAAASERAAAESFERVDTDGFVTQWAHGVTADRDRLQAAILEDGGLATFPALFDDEEQYVPAFLNRGRFGPYWKTIDGRTLKFGSQRRLREEGLTEGLARFPAEAIIDGEGTGLSGRAWAAASKTVRETVPPTEVVVFDRRAEGVTRG